MNPADPSIKPGSLFLSNVWKATLLLIPLVIAGMLFWLRQTEVHQLRNRHLGSYGTVPPFTLVSEKGEQFGSAQLQGKIWIADFIFTNCQGPCPIISTRMAEMQRPLQNTGVHFVSVSVDPERDTPAVLRDYAEKVKAQPARWDFLTGSKSAIYDLTRHGFKLGISDGKEEIGQPVHSTRMVLVDRHGTIRGYYDALAADGVTKILADTNHLLREQPQ